MYGGGDSTELYADPDAPNSLDVTGRSGFGDPVGAPNANLFHASGEHSASSQLEKYNLQVRTSASFFLKITVLSYPHLSIS